MGGSCGNCSVGAGAPPMTAMINANTREFSSAYFVLDITDPESDPKLLWSFTDRDLGLTTALPVVARVNPTGDAMTSNTNAKWYAIFGAGPNSYLVIFRRRLFLVPQRRINSRTCMRLI